MSDRNERSEFLAGDPSPRWIPGPWETHVSWDVTGYPCFFVHGLAGGEKRDLLRLTASSRLIAAAPDLYRELAHLVRRSEPLEVTGLNVPGLATLNGARAALRKAEGR